jgi:acetyl/propionyl-CoA carboxylase alpha subunit
MGEAALRAARAVGYTNAGTVEFLLDRDGKFYFLEMNTRLQVEHAVTELVTGIDIVKEQLTIAAGRRLRWRQEDVQIIGHAIECRITAEDPYNDFMPVAGRITSLIEPTGPGVRLESGIYAGCEVTPYYDPLMRRALEELRIGGIHTSVPFHQRVMDSARFQTGQFDTSFVEGPDGFCLTCEVQPELMRIAAIAAALVEKERGEQALMLGHVHQHAGGNHSGWKQAAWRHFPRGW